MYGMIWYLAMIDDNLSPKEGIEAARKHYKEGLRFAKTYLKERDLGGD
jgi:hypothetical protein